MPSSPASVPDLRVRAGGRAHRDLVLTPRQAEILSLIALGMSDKEIALRLGVAPRTIRTHLERLFQEYGLSSRSAAVAAWLRGKHRRALTYRLPREVAGVGEKGDVRSVAAQ